MLTRSASHTRALYYINGTTGDIIWKLGGKNSSFTFGPNATFYGQQDARFVDGPAVISMHVGEATTGQTSACLASSRVEHGMLTVYAQRNVA